MDPQCAQASLDVGELIAGTAVESTDLWILLEFDRQWAPKILDTPTLPPSVKAWLRGFQTAYPSARVQLIRRPKTTEERGPSLFLVRSAGPRPVVFERQLDTVEHAADIALGTFVSGRTPQGFRIRRRPLYLVCAHSKRDACCARFGPAVYAALSAERPGEVWQSSHIGGHRFAATMLCFPHGVCYGRLVAGAATRAAAAYEAGSVGELGCYRGRTSFPRPVQVAEHFLRQATGLYRLDAVRFVRHESLDAPRPRWRVCFVEREADEMHELTVTAETTMDAAPRSCGKAPEPVIRYQVDSHRQLDAT